MCVWFLFFAHTVLVGAVCLVFNIPLLIPFFSAIFPEIIFIYTYYTTKSNPNLNMKNRKVKVLIEAELVVECATIIFL